MDEKMNPVAVSPRLVISVGVAVAAFDAAFITIPTIDIFSSAMEG